VYNSAAKFKYDEVNSLRDSLNLENDAKDKLNTGYNCTKPRPKQGSEQAYASASETRFTAKFTHVQLNSSEQITSLYQCQALII
jgi:hypothetical protein